MLHTQCSKILVTSTIILLLKLAIGSKAFSVFWTHQAPHIYWDRVVELLTMMYFGVNQRNFPFLWAPLNDMRLKFYPWSRTNTCTIYWYKHQALCFLVIGSADFWNFPLWKEFFVMPQIMWPTETSLGSSLIWFWRSFYMYVLWRHEWIATSCFSLLLLFIIVTNGEY